MATGCAPATVESWLSRSSTSYCRELRLDGALATLGGRDSAGGSLRVERGARPEHARRPARRRPAALLIPFAIVLGLALLRSLGCAQWWVLRRYLSRARTWILANALAWLVGLARCVPVMSALITEESSTAAAAIGIGAGLLMGATVAAVTGCFLLWMLPPR